MQPRNHHLLWMVELLLACPYEFFSIASTGVSVCTLKARFVSVPIPIPGPSRFLGLPGPNSVVLLAMTLSVMLVVQKQVFVATVCSEGHRRDAQPGEGGLEPIPPAKEAYVSPFLAVRSALVSRLLKRGLHWAY